MPSDSVTMSGNRADLSAKGPFTVPQCRGRGEADTRFPWQRSVRRSFLQIGVCGIFLHLRNFKTLIATEFTWFPKGIFPLTGEGMNLSHAASLRKHGTSKIAPLTSVYEAQTHPLVFEKEETAAQDLPPSGKFLIQWEISENA